MVFEFWRGTPEDAVNTGVSGWCGRLPPGQPSADAAADEGSVGDGVDASSLQLEAWTAEQVAMWASAVCADSAAGDAALAAGVSGAVLVALETNNNTNAPTPDANAWVTTFGGRVSLEEASALRTEWVALTAVCAALSQATLPEGDRSRLHSADGVAAVAAAMNERQQPAFAADRRARARTEATAAANNVALPSFVSVAVEAGLFEDEPRTVSAAVAVTGSMRPPSDDDSDSEDSDSEAASEEAINTQDVPFSQLPLESETRRQFDFFFDTVFAQLRDANPAATTTETSDSDGGSEEGTTEIVETGPLRASADDDAEFDALLGPVAKASDDCRAPFQRAFREATERVSAGRSGDDVAPGLGNVKDVRCDATAGPRVSLHALFAKGPGARSNGGAHHRPEVQAELAALREALAALSQRQAANDAALNRVVEQEFSSV